MNDYDLHTRAPRPLVEAARRKAPELGLAALVRLALAKLAGWPDAAVETVTGARKTAGRANG